LKDKNKWSRMINDNYNLFDVTGDRVFNKIIFFVGKFKIAFAMMAMIEINFNELRENCIALSSRPSRLHSLIPVGGFRKLISTWINQTSSLCPSESLLDEQSERVVIKFEVLSPLRVI
jgi:hypothetical protein